MFVRQNIILLSLIISLHAASLFAQAPDTMWTRTYGGNEYDVGKSVVQTIDGGFVVTGHSESFGEGDADIYLIKTDSGGDTLWTRTYGGTESDYSNSVVQTGDGGYIIAGSTHSFGEGEVNIYLLKVDASGDTLWTRTYGGAGGESGLSVQETSDGGYIITGSTSSYGEGYHDVYLIKTDSSGDTLWTKAYGGWDWEIGWSVQETSDGGYVIAGTTHSFGEGDLDVYLLKTDANGDTLWTKTFGGAEADRAYSITQTAEDGYLIAGITRSFGVDETDVYLIKTDAGGDSLWTRTYGGIGYDVGLSIRQTSNGRFIITGFTNSHNEVNYDIYVIKIDADGDTLWTKMYGGAETDQGYSVTQTADGGYLVAGATRSFGQGNYDVYLIRLTADQTDMEDSNALPIIFSLHQNHPNPFNVSTIILYSLPEAADVTIKIYDILGRRVETLIRKQQPAGYHQVIWDGREKPSGVYFVRLEAGGRSENVKMVLLK